MGGNYERGLYNQLMEVMERLDTVEKESKKEIRKLNDEISTLKKENQQLKEENRLLRDDNARMKSILSNDSSNTSQPPSTTRREESRPILITAGKRPAVRQADRKGTAEPLHLHTSIFALTKPLIVQSRQERFPFRYSTAHFQPSAVR